MNRQKTGNGLQADQENSPGDNWKTAQKKGQKGRKFFIQKIFADWCKACGICIAFCPAHVFAADTAGMPHIRDSAACTGCRFCEFHCPDFAISILECYPDRRGRKNGT